MPEGRKQIVRIETVGTRTKTVMWWIKTQVVSSSGTPFDTRVRAKGERRKGMDMGG